MVSFIVVVLLSLQFKQGLASRALVRKFSFRRVTHSVTLACHRCAQNFALHMFELYDKKEGHLAASIQVSQYISIPQIDILPIRHKILRRKLRLRDFLVVLPNRLESSSYSAK